MLYTTGEIMAKKELYAVRIEKDLLNEIQELAEQRGETVTSIFEQALESFLSAPNIEDDIPIDSADIEALEGRLERIEGRLELIELLDRRVERIEATLKEPKSKPKPEPIHPDDVGELITLEEAAALTGYSKGTLSPKFSKVGIKAVDRVDGNRAGLYSKKEILDKVGYNK